jgi:hypothetical protein
MAITLVAGAAPATAAGDLAIRSITVKPAHPVVGPSGSVKVVIEVVARGATAVSVVLEPGRIGPMNSGGPKAPAAPEVRPPAAPVTPATGGIPAPAQPPVQAPAQLPALVPSQIPMQAPAQLPAQHPAAAQGAAWGTPAPRPAGPVPASTQPALRAVPMSTPSALRSRSEWETWLFLPEKPLSRWYPSGQWTVTATARDAAGGVVTSRSVFFLKRETTLEGVNVVRHDGDVRITGTLLRVDPLGQVDYRPFAGQSVALRFRPAGSRTWRTMGTAVTNKDGWFTGRLNAQGDGLWRAEYAGTGHYAGDISADKHP